MSKTPTRRAPTANRPVSAIAGAGAPTVRVPGASVPLPQSNAPTGAEITAALQRGGAYFAARRFEEAEAMARLVLRFSPKQADALHLLGLVQLALGKPAEAERLMLQAYKQAGPHAVLLVNLGNAARDQKKIEKALKYYDQALALNPAYEEAYIERGIMLVSSLRYAEAAEMFDQAIALNPTNVAAYSGAAHVASERGQYRQAIDYCQAGLKQSSAPVVEMMSMIAVSTERLSELEAAVEAAEKVLALVPDHAACLRVLTKATRRLNKGDKDILTALRQRLEAVDVAAASFEDASVIYSELAHICDELGEYDAAYRYFQMLNQSRYRVIEKTQLDERAYYRHIASIDAAMTPAVLQKVKAHSAALAKEAPGPAHVFIIGFPRSGTTLLDQIMDAHKDVQVIEERPMINELYQTIDKMPGGFGKALQNLRAPQIKRLRDLYRRGLEKQGADFSKRVIIDKLPLNIVHVGIIAAVFPEAKIILALRHPADSCLSCFMQDFELNSAMMNFTAMSSTVELYDLVMGLWQRYETHLDLKVQRVRYENLVADLRGEVSPVLDFLGLDWDEAVADPAAHALERGTIRTPSYAQVTQPIYQSATDRWRRYAPFIADDLPVLEKHIAYFNYSN